MALDFLEELGIRDKNYGAATGVEWNSTCDQGELRIVSPVDGKQIASVYLDSEQDYERVVTKSAETFRQ